MNAIWPQKLCIFTFTMGREVYLRRLLQSIYAARPPYAVEHHVCFQGVHPSPEMRSLLSTAPAPIRCVLHEWPENLGVGLGMNKLVPTLDGDLIMKFDEDGMIVSADFFEHVAGVFRCHPEAVLSPFPVGLIGSVGGTPALSRHVLYDNQTETFYTFRRVAMVGGFARIAPGHLAREWRFPDDRQLPNSSNEDQHVGEYCRMAGVPMYYLENSLIVEHQESTLGQLAREGKDISKLGTASPRDAWRHWLVRCVPPVILDTWRTGRQRRRLARERMAGGIRS